MSAFRHGLTGRKGSLALGESPEEYHELERSLRDALEPHGAVEEMLFADFVDRVWRLRRVAAIEAQLFSIGMARDRARLASTEMNRHQRREGGIDQDWGHSFGTVRITDQERHSAAAEKLDDHNAFIASDEVAHGRIFEDATKNGDLFSKLNRYERQLYGSMRRSYADLRAEQARRFAP